MGFIEETKKFIEELDYGPDQRIPSFISELTLYMAVFNTLYNKPCVQEALRYIGPKSYEWGDTYCGLLFRVYEEAGSPGDNGTNYRTEEMIRFTSWVVDHVHKAKVKRMTATKRDKLKQLEDDRLRVERELKELLSSSEPPNAKP